ncbi:hypothetical protein FAES_4049 [Fibrella aestuarina BUZ 2]|uniref:ParB/Sulfiredoxin domain-containing protein n=1 Tax=Fibrella aestuarina BUZ 2 TaxID=1166018 RepID=I0KD46_9BACT|nr:hypothetical protein [Fibrella aestuarina]CCH02049.1 hypothetical protein FAES_4049 [Fibrella aestuarina BUZ 2]
MNTPSMTVGLEEITPEVARTMLADNQNNRTLTNRHVDFLAEQMRAGKWQVTGEPIKIATTGRLLDGQHRLMAVVKSDTTQSFWVARNCDPEIFSVLDTGRVRRAADVLSIEGYKNVSALSGLIRLVILHQQGRLSSWGVKTRTLTNQDIVDFQRQEDMTPYINVGVTLYAKSRLLTTTEYAFLYYLLGKLDNEQALAFVKRIASGAGLVDNSPELLLRQRLEAGQMGRLNLSNIERLTLCIKAWNARRGGEALTVLRVSASEGFPTPK